MIAVAIITTVAVGTFAFAADAAPWATRELSAGVIGTDTSHVPAFAGLFRSHPEWKIKVVAAFKGGSPDLPASADRIERFATTMREKFQVEFVNSIEELMTKVDVVLLQSVDGRVHLEQVKPVFQAGKRVRETYGVRAKHVTAIPEFGYNEGWQSSFRCVRMV